MTEKTDKSVVGWIWNGFFALIYPIIMTFTLLFFALTWILSNISKLIRLIWPKK